MRTRAFCLPGIVAGLLLWIAAGAAAQPASEPAPAGETSVEQTVRERITTIRERQTQVVERRREDQRIRRAAIFVKNRASNVADDKVAVLEDFVTSLITDKGFEIISREDVLNAVASFADAGPNQGDADLPGAKLDAILSNNTSALRLAQNLGADYILVASITTYGNDTVEYDDQGIHTLINESKMEISYKMLDATAGGSLSGGVVEAVKKDRAQPGLKIKRDMVNALLKDASVKLADALGTKAREGRIREAQKAPGLVEFGVLCSMADLAVPEVTKNQAGEYVVTANRYTVQAMAVTVAVDGVTIGTTPGPFQALPGLHKIRLSREGFKDWEQTINIREGMTLNVAMQLTDPGYARWRENSAFLEGMKTNAKLTDAEVKAYEGFARMLEQSGFKVDVKKDVREDVNYRKDVKSDTTIVDTPGDTAPLPPPREPEPVRQPAPQGPPAREPANRGAGDR